jgi:protein SCO1/2
MLRASRDVQTPQAVSPVSAFLRVSYRGEAEESGLRNSLRRRDASLPLSMTCFVMGRLLQTLIEASEKSRGQFFPTLRLRFFLTCLIFLVTLFAPVQDARAHGEQQVPLTEITLEQRLSAQLPLELEFVDESGGKVVLGDFFNSRPVLLAFVYYECPQVCPLVLDGLVRSLRVLSLARQEYEVIVVSIDPGETPALAASKKQQYLTRLNRADAPPRWHFLTGEAPSIEALARAAGFRYAKEPSSAKTQYIHPAVTMVLTPGGRISHYLNGFDYAPKDLRFALIEASGNRIGSALDHLLLLCYQYDPARGKYTVAILNVLRFSGIATVLCIGVFLLVMLRRERARGPLRGVS